jgi:UDP-N-acetylmuramoyl-tripeptide--D-alanyl-D-alanine ligase
MAEFDFAQIGRWLGSSAKVAGRVRGFKQNSREVLPGELFFALKGEKVDGHAYLKEAAAKGAIGAVVSKAYKGESFGLPFMRVENGVESLQHLAKTVHAARKMRVVAVTGSVGKTTTKEFIATLLGEKFRMGKTPGNANSQVGLPLSILNLRGDEEVLVLEMGMSLPHEIEKLVAIAPPEVAVITKIALAHAAFFPTGLQGIAAAKAEILSHAHTRVGIINHQVAQFQAVGKSGRPTMTYGMQEEGKACDVLLCREGPDYYVKEGSERSALFALPFSAEHLCENFIGAVCAAQSMGMQWSEVVPQIQKLSVVKHRFERIERGGIVFIDDAYNANPTSMKAALTNLPAPYAGKKRVAVLGAMKELGEHTATSHRAIAEIALAHVDYLLCLGEECTEMVEVFERANKPVEHFETLEAMKYRLFAIIEEGDVVLIKGANSKKLWKILEE